MKVISVPITLDAMLRLDTDSCLDGDLVELELTQVDFDYLWESGFFDELNNELSLMIDDFEDESIEYIDIDKAIDILDRYLQKSGQDGSCFLKIKTLFKLANDRKTGIFFYF
jgi:hypothetical protein